VILDRQDAVQHLDDRDLGAELVVEVSKLHADGASADDDEAVDIAQLQFIVTDN